MAGRSAASDEAMRGAGLSRAKVAYLRDLAMKVTNDTVHLESLEALANADVVAAVPGSVTNLRDLRNLQFRFG